MNLWLNFFVVKYNKNEDAEKAFSALRESGFYREPCASQNFNEAKGSLVKIQKTGDTRYDNLVEKFLREQEGAFPKGV